MPFQISGNCHQISDMRMEIITALFWLTFGRDYVKFGFGRSKNISKLYKEWDYV